jgi:hypothetical protein
MKKWELLARANTTKDFSDIFVQNTYLRGKLLSTKFRQTMNATWNGEKEAKKNPRLTASLKNWTFEDTGGKRGLFLSETLYCHGQNFKTLKEAIEAMKQEEKATKTVKLEETEDQQSRRVCWKGNCTFEVRWEYLKEDNDFFFKIFTFGRHCENRPTGFRRDCQLHPETKKKIRELYALLIPPKKAWLMINDEAKQVDLSFLPETNPGSYTNHVFELETKTQTRR